MRASRPPAPHEARALLGVSLALVMILAAAAVPAAAESTPRVSVTSPSYDAPGATVSTVITVINLPAGWSAAMSARVGGWATSCDPFQWRHGPGGKSVSQKCYANLPTRHGSWTLRGTAALTRPGWRARVYSDSKTIKTRGYVTGPVSASIRAAIGKCYNTTKDVQLTFDDGYTSASNLNSILATLKANNVRGRFFLVGSWSRGHRSMVNQIKAGGHYVENHTNTHPALNQTSGPDPLRTADTDQVPARQRSHLRQAEVVAPQRGLNRS